jgi:hypothetical protein
MLYKINSLEYENFEAEKRILIRDNEKVMITSIFDQIYGAQRPHIIIKWFNSALARLVPTL